MNISDQLYMQNVANDLAAERKAIYFENDLKGIIFEQKEQYYMSCQLHINWKLFCLEYLTNDSMILSVYDFETGISETPLTSNSRDISLLSLLSDAMCSKLTIYDRWQRWIGVSTNSSESRFKEFLKRNSVSSPLLIYLITQ